MKIDYTQKLVGFDGEPFKLEDGGKDLTIKDAILAACRAQVPGDDQLSPMDKFAIGEIGHLVSKDMDLTTEQVAKVKDRCGKIFTPALIYDLFTKIEATGKPAKAAKK